MKDGAVKAYAKINLCLDVLGRRENGYHDVCMVMQTISLHDLIRLKLTDEPGVKMTCNWDFLPVDENNLAVRAALLMLEEFRKAYPGKPVPGIEIELEKHIPAAAGMAGGSTDAAAVLRECNTLLNLHLSVEKLQELGVSMGADIPYCVTGGTMLAEGIGEILSPLSPMPECIILTATPEIHVSTGAIYKAIDSVPRRSVIDIDGMKAALAAHDLNQMASSMGNLMELVTIDRYPGIQSIKQVMEETGALKAMMSGSGPTVFGVFRTEETAKEAGEELMRLELVKQYFISTPCNETLL